MQTRKRWLNFWQGGGRYTALWFMITGLFAGIFFSGAFASFLQYSNTMTFCISCHEMESTVFQEYQQTPHYKNPSGVRVTCADCHVPHEDWLRMAAYKVVRTKELFHHVAGTLDTREKFEAKRLELANAVWKEMESNDSKACRKCHSFEAMETRRQKPRAKTMHQAARGGGGTCIDCHRGLAHKPVEEPNKDETPQEDDFAL